MESYIEKQSVKTLSFYELIKNYNISQIDTLQIDAERMDAKLISWFPFNILKRSLIHHEIAHMSSDEYTMCANRLNGFGYKRRKEKNGLEESAILI